MTKREIVSIRKVLSDLSEESLKEIIKVLSKMLKFKMSKDLHGHDANAGYIFFLINEFDEPIKTLNQVIASINLTNAIAPVIEGIRVDLDRIPDEYLQALVNKLSNLFEFPLPNRKEGTLKQDYISEVLNQLDSKLKTSKKLPELYLKALSLPSNEVQQMAIKITSLPNKKGPAIGKN